MANFGNGCYLGLIQKFFTETVFMENFNLKLNSLSFLLSVEYSAPSVPLSYVPNKAHFNGNTPA